MKIENTKIRKKIIVTFFLIVIFTFSFLPYNRVQAGTWGEEMLAAIWTETMRQINRNLEGSLLGFLKQQAINTLDSSIDNAIAGGGGGSPLFVTNWENFLFNNPEKEANLYMNSFFSNLTSGRGSFSSYIPAGAFGPSANYLGKLVEVAKRATTNPGIEKCNITNISDIFTSGSWEKFNTLIGTDTCNQFGLTNISQSIYSSRIARNRELAAIQGQAYRGYLPKVAGGSIITPGSLIADIQAGKEDFANKVIAGASNPYELTISIVSSVISRMATRTILQGVGQAQQYIQRETTNVVNNYNQQIRKEINRANIDPRKIFKPRY